MILVILIEIIVFYILFSVIKVQKLYLKLVFIEFFLVATLYLEKQIYAKLYYFL